MWDCSVQEVLRDEDRDHLAVHGEAEAAERPVPRQPGAEDELEGTSSRKNIRCVVRDVYSNM